MKINKENSSFLIESLDAQYVTLGTFFDEIFKSELIIDSSTGESYNIIDRNQNIRLEELLPSELENYSVISSTSLSRLRTEDNDYSLGNNIADLFFDNSWKTITCFTDKINSVITQPEVTIHYSLFKEYIFLLIESAESGVSKKLSNYLFDSSKIASIIHERLTTLQEQKLVSETLALLFLSFILIRVFRKSEANRRAALYLLWSQNTNSIIPSDEYIEDISSIDSKLLYAYAYCYFELGYYTKSISLSEKLKTRNASITEKAKYYLLYSQHLLWGRGCEQNTKEAFKVLTKQYDKLSEITPKQSGKSKSQYAAACEIKTSILGLYKMIALGYFKDCNFDIPEYLSDNFELLDAISPEASKISDTTPLVPEYETFNFFGQITLSKENNSYNSCLSNNISSYSSKVFLSSLPNYYKNMDFYDESGINNAISASAYNGKKTIIALLSDNENTNLNDCVSILNRLFELMESEPNVVLDLSNNIDIYVKAEYDFASIIIDSILSSFHENYLRVHICDYNRLSARTLLYKAPLFLPCLANNNRDINVVVFGNGDSAYTLIKEMIAIGYTGIIPRITLLGNNSDYYKQKLIQDCPGIFKESERIPRIVPEFFSIDLDSADYVDLFSNPDSKKYNPAIYSKLSNGNYFIVDLEDDRKSIFFATKLRGLLLINSSFTKAPFIAVKCESGITSDSVRNMVINNKNPGNGFYNNYNLYCYGMYEAIFNSSALNITKNDYMRMGLNVHLSYCQSLDKITPDKAVLNDYFSFSYNRDSSECKGISALYLLFSLGIIRNSNDFKKDFIQLSNEFHNFIQNKNNLHKALIYEHSRWVNYMLSRGWRSASLKQALAYLGQESGKDHKHLMCKLHPFICNFNDFIDNPEQYTIIKEIENIIGLRSPYESTKQIIMDTDTIMLNSPNLTISLQSNTIE